MEPTGNPAEDSRFYFNSLLERLWEPTQSHTTHGEIITEKTTNISQQERQRGMVWEVPGMRLHRPHLNTRGASIPQETPRI